VFPVGVRRHGPRTSPGGRVVRPRFRQEASRVLTGLCPRGVLRAVPYTFPVLLGLFFLPGCDPQGYPQDLICPVRDDAIVTTTPTSDPTRLDAPGQWAFLLPDFKKEGGQELDPNKLTGEQRQAFQSSLADLFGTPAHPKVGRISAE